MASTPIMSSLATISHIFRRERSLWLLLFLALAPLVSAAPENIPAQITAPAFIAPVDALIIDDRTPTRVKGRWTMVPHGSDDLKRRDDGDASPTPTATEKVKATDDPTTLTISVGVPSTTVPAPSPLPSPFDTSLAFNFTSNGGASCPRFINNLLTNPNFKKCYPLSMLLQGSKSFFEAEKSLVSIVKVLDASCSADVDFCTQYLNGVVGNLTLESNCGPDFAKGNPIVMQTYLGLKSYRMLYSATCLTDPDTSIYCFANAVTNLTTPANVYFYYLPLNMSLPASANPSCGSCLQRTMDIFQAFTADRDLAIASTYVDAAQQVNTMCGPGYVNETLLAAVSMAGLSLPSWALTTMTLAFALAFNFL